MQQVQRRIGTIGVHGRPAERWQGGTLVAVAVIALWAVSFTETAAAQIVTGNAGVTSPAIPTLRESLLYRDATNYRSLRWGQQLLVGLDPTLELRVTLPTVLDQDVKFRAPSNARVRKSMSGLGDLEVALKKSLYQTDDILESTRWAVQGRVAAPTGDEDRSSNGVELPRKLQLGLGSWGLGAATIFTVIRDRHRLSVEASYLHYTRHDGFRPGPETQVNLAYWFRLWPAVFDPELQEVEVRPVLELLSRHRFSSRSSTGRPRDDGWVVSVAPGLQIYPRTDLLFEFNVEIPVYQNVDDPLGHRRWGATFALKYLF